LTALFRLTEKAKEDLKSIGRYTEKAWGRAQRNKYLALLDERFHTLAKEPGLGRNCEEIRAGYRKFYEGRHLIFYRKVAVGIEIIRILHGSMDVETHLTEER
jgi:toxin ParE1/3/4